MRREHGFASTGWSLDRGTSGSAARTASGAGWRPTRRTSRSDPCRSAVNTGPMSWNQVLVPSDSAAKSSGARPPECGAPNAVADGYCATPPHPTARHPANRTAHRRCRGPRVAEEPAPAFTVTTARPGIDGSPPSKSDCWSRSSNHCIVGRIRTPPPTLVEISPPRAARVEAQRLDTEQVASEAGNQRVVETTGDRQRQGALGEQFTDTGDTTQPALEYPDLVTVAFKHTPTLFLRVVEQSLHSAPACCPLRGSSSNLTHERWLPRRTRWFFGPGPEREWFHRYLVVPHSQRVVHRFAHPRQRGDDVRLAGRVRPVHRRHRQQVLTEHRLLAGLRAVAVDGDHRQLGGGSDRPVVRRLETDQHERHRTCHPAAEPSGDTQFRTLLTKTTPWRRSTRRHGVVEGSVRTGRRSARAQPVASPLPVKPILIEPGAGCRRSRPRGTRSPRCRSG